MISTGHTIRALYDDELQRWGSEPCQAGGCRGRKPEYLAEWMSATDEPRELRLCQRDAAVHAVRHGLVLPPARKHVPWNEESED